MKLYTEDDMLKAFREGNAFLNNDSFDFKNTFYDLINSLTPIELPTDDEIKSKSSNEYQEQKQSYENSAEMFPSDFGNYLEVGFIQGAKWMKDKIKGGGE